MDGESLTPHTRGIIVIVFYGLKKERDRVHRVSKVKAIRQRTHGNGRFFSIMKSFDCLNYIHADIF
jgi:hypothetical protein